MLMRRMTIPLRQVLTRSWSSTAPSPVQLSFDALEPPEDQRPNETMVICHGLFGSKQNWRTLARRFATDLGMRVYTVDMRNHGLSPHAEPHTSQAMAEDLAYLFRRQGMEKVHVVGHSMGGKAVMALALNSDLNSRLASLIPVDMSPRSEPIEDIYNDYAKGMEEVVAAQVTTRKEADIILEKYEPLPSTRSFLLTNAITPTPHSKPYLTFRLPLRTLADAIPTLGTFPYTPPPPNTPTSPEWRGPTLFIRGTESPYLRPETWAACRAFFPNSKRVDILAGHWVHAERQRETGDAVVQFIGSKEVREAGRGRGRRMVGGVEWLSGP